MGRSAIEYFRYLSSLVNGDWELTGIWRTVGLGPGKHISEGAIQWELMRMLHLPAGEHTEVINDH